MTSQAHARAVSDWNFIADRATAHGHGELVILCAPKPDANTTTIRRCIEQLRANLGWGTVRELRKEDKP